MCDSQQNEFSEGDNRNFLEATHITLMHMIVTKCHWNDVVLIVCYLINHVLSLFLMIFLTVLCLSKTLFPVTHVFGCLHYSWSSSEGCSVESEIN